jgi:ATP/maltotriose-dependent transcriptional regulator MalT
MGEVRTATVSPALDHIIERPRLIARIVEGDARVTVFAAAAGYGKTTLARQWAERQTGPVAWYRTTRASGDVAALAVGMDELLASIAPDLPRDPGRVARIASVNPSPRPLGRALVQTYEPLTQDVLLIVDEWEAAGTEEAEQLLSMLVDGLKIRFLITTRTRPDWFTPRLEVYGEGLEIGVEELTMTDEEATQVLFSASKDSQWIATDLRGWPAAIGLAAIQDMRKALPRSSPPDVLYDFLATEVLGSVPESVVRDLTLLSLAAAADLETAGVLLGDQYEERLSSAQRLGLLRITEQGAILLHPLLREHLITVGQATPGGHDLSERLLALLDARKWEHALAAAEMLSDAVFITTALSRALPDLLLSGRVETLGRWIAACGQAGASGAVVSYAKAELAFQEADFDLAIALGKLAAENLPEERRADAHLVVARAANLAERQAIAAEHAAAASHWAKSERAASAAAWANFLQAVDEESDTAEELLQSYADRTPSGELRLIRLAHGRVCLGLLGANLDDALDDAGVATALLEPEVDPLVRSSFLNMLATGSATAGRYKQSLEAALLELAVAEEYDFEFVRRYGLLARARALIGLRDLTPAEKALREVERRLRTSPDAFLDASCAIERARLYITLGDNDRAFSALAPDLERRVGSGARGEYLSLRALILSSSGKVEEAVSSARRARTISRAVATQALSVVAEAITREAEADSEIHAQRAFAEVLSLGGADALILGCRASRRFAERVAANSETRNELVRLFVESNDNTLARAVGVRPPRSVRRALDLSPREAEIHQLIAQGLTNPEISRLLFISPSTTKVHVRHILEKLGVRSRVEAARVWEPETPS